MIQYPARFSFDKKDRAYNVEFPDLPGCLTFGESLDEALDHAREALSGYLESLDQRQFEIPKASRIKGKNIHLISPHQEPGPDMK